MALAVWPSFMPKPSQNYAVNPESAVIRTDMDSRRSRQRLKYSTTIFQVAIAWQMTDTQLDYFNGFYFTVLKSGTLPFLIDLEGIGTNAAYQWEFVTDFQSVHSGILEWNVSATLQRIARP